MLLRRPCARPNHRIGVAMNRDDQDAALAHQQELERRRRDEENEMLGDPEYLKWLAKTYEQVTHEISSESIR